MFLQVDLHKSRTKTRPTKNLNLFARELLLNDKIFIEDMTYK